jgi:hypothetical protein
MYDITPNRLQQTIMQSALEHLNEYRDTLKMSTGSVDLDWLIDNIEEGLFYLFYSTHRRILDALAYRANPSPPIFLTIV